MSMYDIGDLIFQETDTAGRLVCDGSQFSTEAYPLLADLLYDESKDDPLVEDYSARLIPLDINDSIRSGNLTFSPDRSLVVHLGRVYRTSDWEQLTVDGYIGDHDVAISQNNEYIVAFGQANTVLLKGDPLSGHYEVVFDEYNWSSLDLSTPHKPIFNHAGNQISGFHRVGSELHPITLSIAPTFELERVDTTFHQTPLPNVAHSGYGQNIKYSPDDRHLILLFQGEPILKVVDTRTWQLVPNTPEFSLDVKPYPGRAMAIDEVSNKLYIGMNYVEDVPGSNGIVELNMTNFQPAPYHPYVQMSVVDIDIDPSTRKVIVSGKDPGCRVYQSTIGLWDNILHASVSSGGWFDGGKKLLLWGDFPSGWCIYPLMKPPPYVSLPNIPDNPYLKTPKVLIQAEDT